MNKLTEWLDTLRSDLSKLPNGHEVRLNLFRSHPNNARMAVEEAIKTIRGDLTAEDRDVLGQISSSQLIQLLVAGMGNQLFDIPTVLPLEAQSLDDPNVQVLSRMPKLTPNETAVIKRVGLVRERVCGEPSLLGVKPTDIYAAGLQAAAEQVQDGDRSADKALIRNTHQDDFKRHQDAQREARLFKSFKDLFFAAAAKCVPFGIQVETAPSGIKFVVAEVTGENIKQALDTGIHGLIGGKRLQEVISENEWASRFFLLRGEVDGKLANGVQPEHPTGLLDYTATYTLIDTPEGYEDKFLYVIASQGVRRT